MRRMIEFTKGAWSPPVVLVQKNQSWCFFFDYRKLNAITWQDTYPLPRVDKSLDALAGSWYFCILDLTSGYWQFPPKFRHPWKVHTHYWFSLCKWKVLLFELKSALATFLRFMEQVHHGLHWKTLLLYLDNMWYLQILNVTSRGRKKFSRGCKMPDWSSSQPSVFCCKTKFTTYAA